MTSLICEPEVDLELFVEDDFDFEIPCEARGHKHKANWFAARVCCAPNGEFVCHAERRRWLGELSTNTKYVCKFCRKGLYIDSIEWRPIDQ